jgi:hypothetical protein
MDTISDKEFAAIVRDMTSANLNNDIAVSITCAIEHALHSDIFNKRYGFKTVNHLLHYVRNAESSI